jgi:hypothetical protein
MELVIAYFGLFVVGAVELRYALRDRGTKQCVLLLLAALCHLVLVLSYLSRLQWLLAAMAP